MTHQAPRSSIPRRRFLRAAVGLGAMATAGCLGSGGDRYEPTPVGDPPDGTPGEFYYVLEERVEGYDITVEALYENDGDLILEYYSNAETAIEDTDDTDDTDEADVDELLGGDPVQEYTLDEIGIVADAFNEVLIKQGDGSSYGMLIGDIVNPMEGQAYGWGAKSAWFEQYNDGEMDETQLIMSISQLQVYEADIDEVS